MYLLHMFSLQLRRDMLWQGFLNYYGIVDTIDFDGKYYGVCCLQNSFEFIILNIKDNHYSIDESFSWESKEMLPYPYAVETSHFFVT